MRGVRGVRGVDVSKQPKLRLRLRTVLLILSLSVFVLPIASLQVLRIYESVLLRQTQGSLIAQTAFAAAAYRSALRRELGNANGTFTASQL